MPKGGIINFYFFFFWFFFRSFSAFHSVFRLLLSEKCNDESFLSSWHWQLCTKATSCPCCHKEQNHTARNKNLLQWKMEKFLRFTFLVCLTVRSSHSVAMLMGGFFFYSVASFISIWHTISVFDFNERKKKKNGKEKWTKNGFNFFFFL